MAKEWYVLHTLTGQEDKVEKYLRLMVEEAPLQGVLFDVSVPSEKKTEQYGNNKKRTVKKKFLPGYMLVELDLPDRGWKTVVSEINKVEGVTGFIGGSGTSGLAKPTPISSEEAKAIFQRTGAIKVEKIFTDSDMFKVGESVKVIEGPFSSFDGKIEEVFADKRKLKVTVGIFGRNTPVEVTFEQVEKIV